MKFEIEIITPTLIKSQNSAYPFEIFRGKDGKLLLIDSFRILELISDIQSKNSKNAEINEPADFNDFKAVIDKLLEFKKNAQSNDRIEYMKDLEDEMNKFYNKYSDIIGDALILDKIDDLMQNDESYLRTFEIFYPINYGGGNNSVYLPGSSVKGSLISALFHRYKREWQCNNKIELLYGHRDKSIDSSLRDIGSLIQVDDFIPKGEIKLGLIKIQRESIKRGKQNKKGIFQYIIAITSGKFVGDISFNWQNYDRIINRIKKDYNHGKDENDFLEILKCGLKIGSLNPRNRDEMENLVIKGLVNLSRDYMIEAKRKIDEYKLIMDLDIRTNFTIGAYRGALLMGIDKYFRSPPETIFKFENKILGQVKLEVIQG